MIQSDVVVIGGGLAGMIAALASARQGKRVTLLTYGAGSLTANSGTIDILGYDEKHRRVKNPRAAIKQLPPEHPYQKIGLPAIEAAVAFFRQVMEEQDFPYQGSLAEQIEVPTAIGTLKLTGLAPQSFAGSEAFPGKQEIVVVDIRGLKDFYGNIMIQNLRQALGEKLTYTTVSVDTGLLGGHDLIIQDVARWLDTAAGRASFLQQLQAYKQRQDAVLVVPQALGTHGCTVYDDIRSRLGTDIVETTSLPPSINGMRLQNALLQALRTAGVDIVENTRVLRAEHDGKRVQAVIAQSASNERRYYAEKFILATGGFYSGGITMRDFEQPHEEVFDLPVYFVSGEHNWTNQKLFADRPQGYAKTGVLTDEALRPVAADGKPVYTNVHVVGRTLGGYDFCFEHSGNGVALASAYKAAMI